MTVGAGFLLGCLAYSWNTHWDAKDTPPDWVVNVVGWLSLLFVLGGMIFSLQARYRRMP